PATSVLSLHDALPIFLRCLLLMPMVIWGQDGPIDLQPKDTVAYKDEFGLRAGIDLSKLAMSFIDEDYTGLELVGDYRLTRKLYLDRKSTRLNSSHVKI